MLLYPVQGRPDVPHGHRGEEGGHRLILKQSSCCVPPSGLTQDLGGHGEQPLENVLGPNFVPGTRGPEQQLADCSSHSRCGSVGRSPSQHVGDQPAYQPVWGRGGSLLGV